jgi:hypothetical protein
MEEKIKRKNFLAPKLKGKKIERAKFFFGVRTRPTEHSYHLQAFSTLTSTTVLKRP